MPASVVVAGLMIGVAVTYSTGSKTNQFQESAASVRSIGGGEKGVAQAIELPVAWGDLGAQMIAAGVIDRARLEALYVRRGGLNDYEKQLLEGSGEKLMVTPENSGFILNLLWAFGLSNKNEILEEGPMADPRYGGAGQFASTGGWTIAKGDAMDHYSKHRFISLTAEQQALVERVSKNIYRPCCGNSTYFPDCNHGMAMLGLLELLAFQGASEEQMYSSALVMNSYWFPEQYAVIARYLESKGASFQSVDPKEILGAAYSSGSGIQRVASLIPPEAKAEKQQGGGCGV